MTATGRHWQGGSRGGRFGNLFFVLLVRHGGRRVAPFFLFWVALYFLAAAPTARRASGQLAERLGIPRGPARWRFAFRHFFTFGLLLIDRIAILHGQQKDYELEEVGRELIPQALAKGRGALLLTAHLGNWEAMAQLARRIDAPLRMVMFQDATGEQNHAPLAAQRGVELISSDGSPASAAAILAALREGCLVGMMADRVLTGAGIEMEFLGAPAAFPASPFAIAAAAGAPVVFCFAVRTGPSRYRFEGRSPEAQVPDRPIRRSERHIYWTRQFAQALEQLVREHPEQWGNFYSFWKTGGSPR